MSLSEAYLAEDGRVVRRPVRADLIGRLNERRAVEALSRPEWAQPGWFRLARPATRHEDCQCKKDIIIITCDRGELGVQIKSSARSARRFMRRNCPSDVVCVALLDCDTFDIICEKIIGALTQLRKKRRTKRRPCYLRRAHCCESRRTIL